MSETVVEDGLSTLMRHLRFRARVFFRSEYCGSWAVDTSGSQQVPFHMVCQGEGWLHSANAEPTHMIAGQLVLFPGDKPHVLANSDDPPADHTINTAEPGYRPDEGASTRLVCGYFEFDQRAAGAFLSSLPGTMIVDVGKTERSDVRELVNLWISESREDQMGTALAVDLLAELVFLQMLRAEAQAGRMGGVVGALTDTKLGAALHAMHTQPELGHSNADLARTAGMSESAFGKRFKRELGMTPGAYLREWRMNMAARALRESERSMLDIALSIGYESEVAFRKAFKSHFGESPGRYRRA